MLVGYIYALCNIVSIQIYFYKPLFKFAGNCIQHCNMVENIIYFVMNMLLPNSIGVS